MGNSETSNANAQAIKNFQIQKYLNQGLNQQQIIKIKEAFDSYQPENGQIDVYKLRSSTEQSSSKQMIDNYLDGKQKINFDDFFHMSRDIVEKQIKKDPGLIIDTSEVHATCLFCPYTEDRPKR